MFLDEFAWLEGQGEDADLLYWAQCGFGWHRKGLAHVGVAVSGGSDSMAMLHLMARAAPHAGWALRAVTVDHGLRPEAAEEAALVAQVCAGLGVTHDVVRWEHGAVPGNLMQAARQARYALLAEWACAHGIAHVAVGHTADDEAEGVLIGLSRAAGLDGLAGMRPEWSHGDVVFRRPFLLHPRHALRAYLTRHRVPWVEDPTNDDTSLTRTKARRALKALKPLGITAERLADVARNLAAAQGLVRHAVARAAQDEVTEVVGAVRFERRSWRLWGPELQRLLLIAMVRWIGGDAHPPRKDKVLALGMALNQRKDATLGGVRFRWQGDTCWVSREVRAIKAAGDLWDGRWATTGTGEVHALGLVGLWQCPDWRSLGVPRAVLEVTPGLWDGERLLSAPCAGFGDATAKVAVSFQQFLLSH